MKNREEYEASIFAKRDALLAKRKKRIQTAVSAVCIIMCFGAAAYAVPKMMNISSGTETSASTTATTAAASDEIGVAEDAVSEGEEKVIHCPMTEFKNEAEEAQDAEFYEDLAETEIALETEIVTEPAHGIGFGIDGHSLYDATAATTKKGSSMGKYTSEQINEAAYSYLTSDEQAAVDPSEAFSTASRTSDGEEYYEILFDGEETIIKITLNAENLELVEKKILATSTSATAALSAYTPAYNPNE